ncbi:MAG: transposase [Candidatus Competibacteraceae bacterium]|nr:transposase [Candidatus Competibacteraceae bacterium]
MADLDLTQPAPRVNTLAEAQALIDQLWTFVRYPGLPLTNNLAERTLGGHVIWRKTSFFTQSVWGLALRPMRLSVVTAAQRLGLNTYQLLCQICGQGLRGEPVTVRLSVPQQLLPAPP